MSKKKLGEILTEKLKKKGRIPKVFMDEEAEKLVNEAVVASKSRTGFHLCKSGKVKLHELIDALSEQHDSFPVVTKAYQNIVKINVKSPSKEIITTAAQFFRKEWLELEVLPIIVSRINKKAFLLTVDALCENNKNHRAKYNQVANLMREKISFATGRNEDDYEIECILCPQTIIRNYQDKAKQKISLLIREDIFSVPAPPKWSA